jgi:predicted dehydrogenase/threonine dehydrogenase-like Zn-dependent dehydrogenase
MKLVLQQLKSGDVEIGEVPCPRGRRAHLLIQSRASLISAGTERMLIEFGRSSLLAKARAQPDKVRQVLDKIASDGLLPTLDAVFSRLGEPIPMGYCNTGVVAAVGEGGTEFQVGDRVASNGMHAEYVCVPKMLCAKIPDGVSDEDATFTVIGSIALQGIRLLAPTIGERIVVSGLGLIGLIAVQILRANGCRVLGIDIDPARLELARRFGCETVDLSSGADPVQAAMAFAGSEGADGVVVAAATKSSEPMRQAALMCRKRGRIVLVGSVGMELNRSDFYKKELSVHVSCAYGPGRYDPNYEDRGQDYPAAYVRWTAQRNFTAILDLLAAKSLNVGPLVTRTLPLIEAGQAYRALTADRATLGIILTYPSDSSRATSVVLPVAERASRPESQIVIGLIGAGNFARATLLPALRGHSARLRTIACSGGISGYHPARKYGFEILTTDYREVLNDPSINLVVITTRHDLHAGMTTEALAAGKHVAVEKPLCLNLEELDTVRRAYQAADGLQLLVGFNRRFSPHAVRMKELLDTRTQPMCMSMMVNAGVVGPESWVHDAQVGGGRIIGEACHWIDLMVFLTGSRVTRVGGTSVAASPGMAVREDKASVSLEFADGSIGTIHYFGNGAKSYPKETLEVFCDGKVLRLDNFRRLTGHGWTQFRKMRLWRQDKGHRQEFRRFIDAVVRGAAPVMPFDQIENVMMATFAAMRAMQEGSYVLVTRPGSVIETSGTESSETRQSGVPSVLSS